MQNSKQHSDLSKKICKQLSFLGWHGRQYAYTHYDLEVVQNNVPKAEVTVIINVDGITEHVLEGIQDFFEKNSKTAHIITIINAEDNKFALQCAKLSHTCLNFKTRIATASAQNVASLFVTSPIIICISGAYSPDSNLIKEFSSVFKDKNVQAARGQICSSEKVEHLYLGHPFFTTTKHPWPMDIDECIAMRASSFYSLGGFDERIHSHFFALDYSIRLYAHYPEAAQVIVPKANIYAPKGVKMNDLLLQKQLGWSVLQDKYQHCMFTYLDVWSKYFQKEK